MALNVSIRYQRRGNFLQMMGTIPLLLLHKMKIFKFNMAQVISRHNEQKK